MRIALDTNAYSDLLRGYATPDAVHKIEVARFVYLPVIVLAEL